MKNNYLIQEDSDPQNIRSLLSLLQMQKILLQRTSQTEQIQFINFSIYDEKKIQVGGVSGWKNYDFAFIESIWIEPRLQKIGLGAELVSRFITKCEQLDCSVVLTTSVGKATSLFFWRKVGFEVINILETNQVEINYLKRSIGPSKKTENR